MIEDLHWADSSTRGFVRFLARTLCSERMLVVGTYRSDELHRRHPLRPLLAELARDPLAHLIELDRLTREEMAEQLEDILGNPADPGLRRSVSTRAARATRCSPRSCSRSGSTGAARCRRRCATR